MAIYLITPLIERPEALRAALERLLPAEDRYALPAQRGWLVRFPGTSVELSNHLGITGGPPGQTPLGSALLVPVSSYYGRGPTEMWEWLKTRFEQ
jgi:hypothetical protein